MAIDVELVAHTPDPERIVAIAARTCISDQSFGDISASLSADDIRRLLATVIMKGHHSVLEHAEFTFAISGVSRVLSHQIVRHRIASYSQLSQQRSDASLLGYVIPPEIRKRHALMAEYDELMLRCQEFYVRLADEGIPIGSARYVLPSSFQTRILMTMNARSLFNLIAQRECGAEEWEFRQVACLIHRRLLDVAPTLFGFAGPPCETDGICPEGETGYQCPRRIATRSLVTNTRAEVSQLLRKASR